MPPEVSYDSGTARTKDARDRSGERMADENSQNRISRRTFTKYAALGGIAAFAAYSGLRYPSGWERWLSYGQKPWELAPGVVDYDYVLRNGYGPIQLGFANDIRNSPPSARILNVAQWYDYWPGKVLLDFSRYMETKWGVSGVSVNWTSNIYTSNEELFTWISQTGRKFDVMFPTNYTVETMEKAGLVVNMNKDWIPNYVNIFGTTPTTWPNRFEPYRADHRYVPDYPNYGGYNNEAEVDYRSPTLNGYAYRMNPSTYPEPRGSDQITWDEQNSLLAVPYQWGTTGIGYRSDVFARDDIEQLGWEVFELGSYKGTPLTKRKMMLDDMREVFTAGLKAVGWKKQVALADQGLTTAEPTNRTHDTGPTSPTGATPATYAEAPFDGQYQWSNNEDADSRLRETSEWLQGLPGMWGFNTPQQGPWLVSKVMYADQAWSGDIMYAVRPNSNLHLPIDYFVPTQGGARWIDNAVIHRECERLWLSHELINFILDAKPGATISSWNLYASPNAWSFEQLYHDPQFTFNGRNLDSSPYSWNQASEHRIYADISRGYLGDDSQGSYRALGHPSILNRCEYQKDVGVRDTLNYFKYWRSVKF